MRSAVSRSLESDGFQSINHAEQIIQTLVSIVQDYLSTHSNRTSCSTSTYVFLSLDPMQIVPDATYIAFYMIAARPGTPGAPPQQSVAFLLLQLSFPARFLTET